jgi:hypothetical protein
MEGYEKVTARVRPFVKDDLKALRRAVGEALERPLPSQDDLIAALIHAAKVAPTAAAVKAYWRDARPWEDEDKA